MRGRDPVAIRRQRRPAPDTGRRSAIGRSGERVIVDVRSDEFDRAIHVRSNMDRAIT
jgi:hypothetical protein